VFWGEWEPESEVTSITNPIPGGPEFIHTPYYVRPTDYSGDFQNTDPFVFGDQFLYTLCRQLKPIHEQWRPTFLRDLAPGSLILFGSLKGGGFVLDTVFVVANGILHNASSWQTNLSGLVSDTYSDVTMCTTYQTAWTQDLRLYLGATPDEQSGEIFSFAPCLPSEIAPSGFARPTIVVEGMITPGLMMGAKVTRNLSLDHISTVWNDIVTQVLTQGLALGTRFDMPVRRGQ
jgi:hypothetical protein